MAASVAAAAASLTSQQLHESPIPVKSKLKSPPKARSRRSTTDSFVSVESDSETVRKSTKTTPVSVVSRHHQAQNYPYFPGFESSPESAVTYKSSPSQKRLSSNTSPVDMLNRVRQSINAKAKTSIAAEVNEKNQAAINGVRDSIDLKRISTTLSSLQLPFADDSYYNRKISSSFVSHSSGENVSNIAAPSHMVYDKEIFRNSYSSLGSSLLETNVPIASPLTPAIVINSEHGLKSHNAEPSTMKVQSPYEYGYESGEGDDEGERDEDQSEEEDYGESRSNLILAPAPMEVDEPLDGPEEELSPDKKVLTEELPEKQVFSDKRILTDELREKQLLSDQLNPEDKFTELPEKKLLSEGLTEELSPEKPKSPEGVTRTLTRKAPPIIVPPSLNACARSVNAGSAESLVQPIAKPKLTRKPPPDIKRVNSNSTNLEPAEDLDDESFSYISSESKNGHNSPNKLPLSADMSLLSDGEMLSTHSTIESNRASNEYEFFYTDGELYDLMKAKDQPDKSTKFPQFPDIEATHHKKAHHESKHHIFKKRPKIKGIDSSVNLLELDTESDVYGFMELGASRSSLNLPSRSSTPVVKAKPVQLKTTMRKTNKRKERKLQFNENKPWKNHPSLGYITEQERKRYEGVWVSNKGSYISYLVTKLTGVDYDKQESEENLTEEEISTKAARLSSKYKLQVDGSSTLDITKLHDLETAEISQLILGSVVKRIWERSRLPPQTLETIWNLVDFRRDGSLNKAEFLVGMWLIDQCLYGRKLPKKVDDIVWESLGYIGINVVLKKKGRR